MKAVVRTGKGRLTTLEKGHLCMQSIHATRDESRLEQNKLDTSYSL
jgi:hypothetical protein